jgi:hypothetical protein
MLFILEGLQTERRSGSTQLKNGICDKASGFVFLSATKSPIISIFHLMLG